MVGIEDEVFLVDAALRLSHTAEEVLPRLELPEAEAGFEAFACELELRSPPSASAADAVATLKRHRAAVRAAGATPLAAGLHPDAALGDARLVDRERYRRVGAELRGLLTQRSPESALHVHVGMPDADTALRAFNGLRAHLPLLAGLAANSPFWFGRDSGMASARAALVRAYPGRGVPPSFRDTEDFERSLETTLRAAGMEDRTQVWWDLRPHAKLGTVEVREMDAQTDLDDAAALAGLIHALALRAAERGAPVDVSRDALDWSMFRAARDGLEAEIVDEDGDVRPLPEVARDIIRRLGEPHDEVERILREGNGADRQRAVHARDGMPGLLRDLAARTVAG